MTNGEACYLYCLAPGARLRPIEATGVDGRAKVQVTAFGEFAALWSKIAVAEFRGAEAEARLADVEWLAPRAVRHEKAIEEAMRWAPVLPAGFATLFYSSASLGEFIAGRREEIAAFFSVLGETREWAVKGVLERARARERLAAMGSSPAGLSPGLRYLREKQRLGDAERQIGPWLAEACLRAAARLRGHAHAFRERRALAPGVEAESEVVVNWAFLVDRADEAAFVRALSELRRETSDRGFDYSLTGPWPPYSFAPALARSAS